MPNRSPQSNPSCSMFYYVLSQPYLTCKMPWESPYACLFKSNASYIVDWTPLAQVSTKSPSYSKATVSCKLPLCIKLVFPFLAHPFRPSALSVSFSVHHGNPRLRFDQLLPLRCLHLEGKVHSTVEAATTQIKLICCWGVRASNGLQGGPQVF